MTTRQSCRRYAGRSLALAGLFALALAQPAFSATHVSGTLHGSVTWTTAGSPYVVDSNLIIASDATLTVNPGVVVKVAGQPSSNGYIYVYGTLQALGTAMARVTFTSLADDSIGGDTAGDGPTSGSPGQWVAIQVNGSGRATFDYATIRYGGWGTLDQNAGAVWLNTTGGATVEIHRSTLTNNQRSGVAVTTGGVATIETSVITNNANGVSIQNSGRATIARTRIATNSRYGLYAYLINPSASSSVMDSEVINNGSYGIYIAGSPSSAALWPHGNRNNIYGNGTRQLYPFATNRDVDWKGNYWGSQTAFVGNSPQCGNSSPSYPGHIQYSDVRAPAGPIRSAYTVVQGAACYYDFVNGGTMHSEVSTVKLEAGPYPPSQALTTLAPLIKYDSQETYRADSAREIVENWGGGDDFNRLLTSNFGYLASSSPEQPVGWLYLDFLGTSYPDYGAATESDYVDEYNNYAEDAWRLHSDPQYANQAYARTVKYDDTGEIFVQYWLFYYYNDPGYFGLFTHEGDWELVQYRLDPFGNPIEAAYAQHDGGERCEWIHVQRTADLHPILYPGLGSHASFFSSGPHLYEAGANGDVVDGLGEQVVPSLIDVSAAATSGYPGWFFWPGKWGGSDSSPRSPAVQSSGLKWYDPRSWSSGISGCTEGQTYPYVIQGRGPSKTVPAPRVQIRRRRKAVVIHYSFSRSVDVKTLGLLTSVDSLSDRRPPLTRLTRIRTRTGNIRRELRPPQGPFRIIVSAVGRNGMRSRLIVKTLR